MKQRLQEVINDFKIKANNIKLFIIKLMIIMFFLVLGFIWEYFMIVALLCAGVFIATDKYENKILYLVFLLPFYNVFRLGTGNTQYNQILGGFNNIYFSVYLLLIFDVCFVIKYINALIKKEKKIDLKVIIPVCLLYLLLVIPKTQITNFSASLSSIIVVTALFVSVWMIFEYREIISSDNFVNIWLYGILLSVVVYCCQGILPNLKEYLTHFSGRFSGLLRDPNYWSFEILGLLLLVTLIFIKKRNYVSYAIKFIILSLLGIISMSKAFLITYIVFVLLLGYYLFCKKIFKKKSVSENLMTTKERIRIVLMWVSIVCILLIGIYFILSPKIDGILNRLGINSTFNDFDSLMNSITTYRWSIWQSYVGEIFSSPWVALFGVGVCSGYSGAAIHSTPIQIMYFGGLFSLLLVIYLIYVLLKNCQKEGRIPLILTIFVLFVMSCSLDLLFSYRTFILLGVVVLGYSLCDKIEQE